MLDGSDDEEDETKHPNPGGTGSKPTLTEEFLDREIWPIVFSNIGMSKRVA